MSAEQTEKTSKENQNETVSTVSNTPKISVTKSEHILNNKKSRKLYIFLVIVVIIFLVILSLKDIHKTSTKTNAVIGSCTSKQNLPTIYAASQAMNANNKIALQKEVAKIQAIPGYQDDPNCLLPIVSYYIDIGNANEASNYLTKLKSVYNPKVGFSLVFVSSGSQTLTFLQNDINAIKQNQQNPPKQLLVKTPAT